MSYGSIPKASLKWDTSYLDYVIISYTGNTTSTSTTIFSTFILDGSYTSPDLSFNTKYTFLLTPYYNGNMGAIKTMIMDTTPPIAGVYSDSISTSSSVQLNWITGNYNYVKISRSTQNDTYVDISTNVIGSQYLDTDISGNGTYNYKITPYMDGIPYSTSSPISVYTNIRSPTNLTISSYDSSSVTVSFIEPKNYYTSSAVYTVYTTDAATANGTSSPLIISGLTANTSYNIFGNVVLDGTNAAAMTGNVMITTYGIINEVTTSAATTTTITLSITGLYSTYNLYYSSNSGSSYSTFGTGFSSSTPQVTGLTTNVGYLFKLTPYNSTPVVGSNFITSTKYYTLPTITAVTTSATTTSDITLSITGLYSTYNLYYSSNNGSSYSTFNTDLSSSTPQVTGLTASLGYLFKLTPYNAAPAAGSDFITTTYNTLPTITDVTTSASSTTAITLSITVGLYSTYNLYYSSNNGSSYSTFRTGLTTSAPQVTGLTTNVGYLFKLTPYNATPAAGSDFITSTKYYTLPTITTVTTTDITASAITLSITGGLYSTYNLYYSSDSGSSYSTFGTGLSSSTPQVTGLLSNTSYLFKFTPYNAAPAAGSDFTTTAYSTLFLPTISDFNIKSRTLTSVTFNITGTYTTATINYGIISGATTYSSTVISSNSGSTNTFEISTNITIGTGTAGDTTKTNYFTITPKNGSTSGSSTEISTTVYGPYQVMYLKNSAGNINTFSSNTLTIDSNNINTTLNGSYTTSASSYLDTTTYGPPYRAFNGTTDKIGWHCVDDIYSGSYKTAGTVSTTISSIGYKGEWLQIQLPYQLYMSGISFYPRQNYNCRMPNDFVIAGSNDGSTWTLLQGYTGKTYNSNMTTTFTFTTPSSICYNYFRLVVTKVTTGNDTANSINLQQWNLLGYIM
jgi:hypothetical protein